MLKGTWRTCAQLALSALLFGSLGCSSSNDKSGSCVPGFTAACSCSDGHPASQTCNASGQFDACQCLLTAGTNGGQAGIGGAAGTLNTAGTTAGVSAGSTAGITAGAAGTTAGGSGAAGTAAGSGGTGAAGTGSAGPGPTMLPTATQTCPTITEGDVMFLGHKVKVWVGADGMSKLGPLVIYWHGTCSSPNEVGLGIGNDGINQIKAAGGMVAAIYSEYLSPNNFCGTGDTGACKGTSTGNGVWCKEDFVTADEVVACAIQQVGIDTKHIHSAGMSAGGLQVVAYSYGRSGYLASVTSYSGGLIGFGGAPTSQDPSNKFAAMIVHGGMNDNVGTNFQTNSENYQADLKARGQFSFICDHGMGHTIPQGIGAATTQFFEDHGWNVTPEPYATMLPASFPTYCKLPVN